MVKSVFTYFLLVVWCSAIGQQLKLDHIRTFSGHNHGVRKVVFSKDGTHFASGGTRGELFIWDIDGANALKKLEGHYASVTDVRYSLDGKYLISTGEDGYVKVWDAGTGYLLQQVLVNEAAKDPNTKVNFAMMCGSSKGIFYGTSSGELIEVAFEGSGEKKLIYSDEEYPIQCGIVSPNDKEIIIAAGKYLMAIDLQSGEVSREYNTGSCIINSLEFSNDGKRLLTWCSNSRVDIRDPSNFYLITSFRSGSSDRKFSNMAFTDDQKYVVTGDHASRFNVWDLEKKMLVLDQWAEQGTILSFDLEGRSNYLITGSLDKTIKLWQIAQVTEEQNSKKKKKLKVENEVVEPEVEIVQYMEPVEDVPQVDTPSGGPAIINVRLKEKEEQQINTYEPTPEPARTIVSELPERLQNRRIKPIRKEHRLKLNGSKLTFNIWDAQVIDGDIVSIYVGDECIVKEYSITAAKKSVTYDASAYKRIYVFLHAHNLGTLPPNTVTMTVSDGETTHEIELRSDLSGSAALELTFEEAEATDE